MPRLYDLIQNNRDWLVRRGLSYARKRCIAKDKTTPDEAWQQFVADLSESFLVHAGERDSLPEWNVKGDYTQDPIASLGIPMVEKYRAADISLSMLLGLMNVWRESCTDLILKEQSFPSEYRQQSLELVTEFLDRLEWGLIEAWTAGLRTYDDRRLLRAVMNTVPDVVIVKDRNAVFLEVSEKHAELLGKRVEDIVGTTDFDIFSEEDAKTYLAEDLRVMESGETVVAEHLLDTSIGPRWFEAIKSPLRDEHGEVIGLLSTERDITKRKQLQAEVDEQRRMLAAVLDTIPEAVVFKGRDLSYLLCNQTFCDYYGCEPENVVGKTDFDLLPPEQAEKYKEEDLFVLETGQTVSRQHQLQTVDGMRWDESIKKPFRNEKGEIVGVVATARDITERVQAQQVLQESEEYVSTILDSLLVGTLVIDAESHEIIDVNPVTLKMIGRSRDEVIGHLCHAYICLTKVGNCPISDLGQEIDAAERVLIHANGRQIPILKTVTPLVLRGRKVLLESFVDISERSAAEKLLKESEERYRNLVENISDMVFSLDLQGYFTYVSPAAFHIGQYTPDDLLGKHFAEFVHPDDLERVSQNIQTVLGGQRSPTEFRVWAKDGHVVYVRTASLPLVQDGQVVGLSGVLSDLTDRVKTEEALRESEERFRTMVENVNDMLFTVDIEGRLTYVSPSAEQILGFTAAEVEGRYFFEFVYPDDSSGLQARFKEIFQGDIVPYEFRVVRKDGRIIHVRTSSRPLYRDGELLGLSGILSDITQRIETEQALARERDFLNALLDNVPDNIYFKDRESHFTRINNAQAMLLGCNNPEEALGKTDFDFFAPEHAQVAYADEQKIVTTGEPLVGKLERTIRADGRVQWMSTTKVPLFDADGQVYGTVGISRSMDEVIKTQAERDEQRRMLQAVLDAMPDYIIFKDRHSAFQLCNKPVLQFFGVDNMQQLIGKSDFDFFEPELAHRFRAEEIEAMETGNPVVRQRLTETAHKSHWEEAIKAPLRDDTGEIIGVLSIGRDITERMKAEEERLEHQRMIQAQMDTTPDTFTLVDRDSVYVLCDKRFAELIGRPVEDIIGKSAFELWPERIAKGIREEDLKVFETGEQFVTEHAFRMADGLHWYEVSKMPVRDEKGQIVGVVSSGHDITGRREMQQRLSTERERLDVTLRSIGDGVVTTDMDGKITLINPVAEKLTGWNHDEALGKSLEEIFHIINEQTGEPAENPVEKVLKTGEIVTLANHTMLISRDGTQRIIADSGAPIRDSSGRILGVVLVFRDVTERQRLEQERDEQQRMLRAVLDGSPDVIFFKDRDLVYRLCNEAFARFYRRSVDEIVGKRTEEVLPLELAQNFREEDLRVLAGEQIIAENRLAMPWGDFWFESIKTPLRDETGEIIGLVSFERDVTQRKQMEESLHESQRSLSALMSSLPGMAYRRQNDELWTMEFVSEGCFAMTGYEPSELLDNRVVSYTQLIHPGERDEVLATVQQAIEEKRPFQITYRIITADGDIRWVHEQGSEVPSIHEGHMHIEGLITDITERVRAEEELNRQTLMLKTLFETTSDILIFKDRRSTFLAASKVIADILKRSQEELVGKTDFDLFPVDQAQVFWDEEQSLMTAGKPLITEHRLKMPDGSWRWFEVVKKPVMDSSGNVIGLFSSEHDVTERKQMEEALASERNLLRVVIDNIPDLIFAKDVESRMTLNNIAHAVALGGTQPEDLLGKTDFDFVPAEQARQYVEADRLAIETGQITRAEETYVDPTGETRWLVTTRVPLRDTEGKITGLVGISHDVTENKRVQEELRMARDELEIRVEERTADLAVANVKLQVEINERREAEAELQWHYHQAERARSETTAILDAAGEAMVLISPERWILTINRRFTEFFGLSQTEMMGNRFEDLRSEMERIFEDPDGMIALVMASTDDMRQQFTQTLSQRWPVRRELELYSTPVRAGEGQHLGRLFVFRDVTKAREVDRMKTEFVSLVSHELRTPLTSIKGYVDLLLGGKVGELDKTQLKFLNVVKSNTERLVALISDLLDISRIESGKIELKQSILDINRMVVDVTNSMQPQIQDKKQKLILDIAPDLPTVWADADRVTLIITNLLSNAHKYTPDGGEITVRVYQTDSMVRVDVHDTGIGMTAEEKAKLFTKFFRSENLMIQGTLGSGLGLVITKSLVEMQGGDIFVETEQGVGSTFSFTLPTSPQVEKRSIPDELSDEMPEGESRRILVVDDEPDIAELLHFYLERSGYQVLVAHSGSEAFSMAQTELPDLITLDVLLPDADGFTVLEWLKSNERTKDIPVVLISVLPDDGHGELLGAIEYLTKPVVEDDLLMHLSRILGDDRGYSILLAEDDADTRRLMAKHLSQAGYRVIEAHSGEEAVHLAKMKQPDLLLLDIKMPVMDGITALRQLRSDKDTQHLAVVMMTASPGLLEASQSVTQTLGVAALLKKPFTPEELVMAINQGLKDRLEESDNI